MSRFLGRSLWLSLSTPYDGGARLGGFSLLLGSHLVGCRDFILLRRQITLLLSLLKSFFSALETSLITFLLLEGKLASTLISLALLVQFFASLFCLSKGIIHFGDHRIDIIRVRFLDIVVLVLGGSFLFLLKALTLLWHNQIGADIVEVVHFLTFVVLN